MHCRPRHAVVFHCPFARHASVSSNHGPFPFPHRTNPTPHDIFHLPRSASQLDIKNRYYELVKVYHPDAAHCQHIPASVCNARFRAITHAYDVLRGQHGPSPGRAGAWDDYASRDEAIRAELRRRARRANTPTTTVDNNINDTHIWYSLVAFVLAGMMAALGSASSHMDRVERHTQSAAANLAQARTDAQVYGMERRQKIRERVKAFREAGETSSGAGRPETRRRTPRVLAELSRSEMGHREVSDDERA